MTWNWTRDVVRLTPRVPVSVANAENGRCVAFAATAR